MKSNQEELLKSFCDNLGNNEKTFLGHTFVLKEEEGFESDMPNNISKSDVAIEQVEAPGVANEPAVALVDKPAVAYVANELPVALVPGEPLVADVPAVHPLADEPAVTPIVVPAEGIAYEANRDQEPQKKQKVQKP